MEKIVMYLKKVIILLCGIVLGYLTSRRTDMSISLECILGWCAPCQEDNKK